MGLTPAADFCGLLGCSVARLLGCCFGDEDHRGSNLVNLWRLWPTSAAHMNVEANPEGKDWKEMGKVFQCVEYCLSSRFADPVMKTYRGRARTLPQVEGSIAERPQTEPSEILTKTRCSPRTRTQSRRTLV